MVKVDLHLKEEDISKGPFTMTKLHMDLLFIVILKNISVVWETWRDMDMVNISIRMGTLKREIGSMIREFTKI